MRCATGGSAKEPGATPCLSGGEESLPNRKPPSSGRLYLTNWETASLVRRAPAKAVSATPLPIPRTMARRTAVRHLARISARERAHKSPNASFPSVGSLPLVSHLPTLERPRQ